MRWAMSRPQRAYCGNALRTRSQNRLATRNSPVLFRLERLIRRKGSTWVSHDIVSNSSQRAKSNLECWYEALPARIAIGGSRSSEPDPDHKSRLRFRLDTQLRNGAHRNDASRLGRRSAGNHICGRKHRSQRTMGSAARARYSKPTRFHHHYERVSGRYCGQDY